GDVWEATIFSAILGFIELSAPDPSKALAHLVRATEFNAAALYSPLPTVFRYAGDLVEAAVLTGDLDLAEGELVVRLEEPAERVPLAGSLGGAGRGRGLLAGARGQVDDAVTWLDRSLAALDGASPMPMERGRTLFVRGSVHRKAGRRRAARADLEAALAIFRRLGAEAWARRAEEEVGAVGGRRGSPLELTTSERPVAEP